MIELLQKLYNLVKLLWLLRLSFMKDGNYKPHSDFVVDLSLKKNNCNISILRYLRYKVRNHWSRQCFVKLILL